MTRTLTADLLAQIMGCPLARAAECLPGLVEGMRRFGITTPRRITIYLAQIRWESGGLKWYSELASGDAYEGRASLGNTRAGDGRRFKGRGPLQLTGRTNYTRAATALGIDLLRDPSIVASPRYGGLTSAWWWYAHGGNEVADTGTLAQANIRAGRLVNRGNANSSKPAQNEAERVSAFDRVAGFGDLALPGTTPAPNPPAPPAPTTGGTLDMTPDDVKRIVQEAIRAERKGIALEVWGVVPVNQKAGAGALLSDGYNKINSIQRKVGA